MKKVTAIAVFALAAGAACSKVETIDSSAPAKIGFEVATATASTKALPESGSSLFDEDNLTEKQFYSFGFLYSNAATGSSFMDNVTIFPYKSDGTAANSKSEVSRWEPASDYYWPKSPASYVNFVAYATNKSLGSLTASPVDAKKVSLSIPAKEIEADDNILIADAVYNAKSSNCSSNTVNAAGETSPVGVPILFRHALARVQFKMQLVAANPTANTDYVVTVTSFSISCFKTGSYSYTNDGPALGDNLAINPWFSTGAVTGWTPTNAGAISGIASPATLELTLSATADKSAEGVLLAERSVVPQNITAATTMTIAYTVEAKHSSTSYVTENFTPAAIALNTSGLPTEWGMNQKITYLVTLDPVTQTVSFDPAVQDWTPVDASGTPIKL